VHGKVTTRSTICRQSRGAFVIAQANAQLDKNGKLKDELVSCRCKNEFMLSTADKVQFMTWRWHRPSGRGVADPVPRA
jgi:DNA-directed RNA polymerase subunit beta